MATGIYSGLTPEEIVSLSYWAAIDAWGIPSTDYPQSYLPSTCGCIPDEVTPPAPPTPPIVFSCKNCVFPPQFFSEILQTDLTYDLV